MNSFMKIGTSSSSTDRENVSRLALMHPRVPGSPLVFKINWVDLVARPRHVWKVYGADLRKFMFLPTRNDTCRPDGVSFFPGHRGLGRKSVVLVGTWRCLCVKISISYWRRKWVHGWTNIHFKLVTLPIRSDQDWQDWPGPSGSDGVLVACQMLEEQHTTSSLLHLGLNLWLIGDKISCAQMNKNTNL